MSLLGKIAEKIGIVNFAGTINVGEIKLDNHNQRDDGERLLLNKSETEIEYRLSHALKSHQFIELDKEYIPQIVKRPWDKEVKFNTREAEALPTQISLDKIFEKIEIGGKILISGSPGTGKTTSMLMLAKKLISDAKAQSYLPVPVIFNLPSWSAEQSLDDWMVLELKNKCGVRQGYGKEWLENRRILPLFDSLNEVLPINQGKCVKAINQYLSSDTGPEKVVICCRLEEYTLLGEKLSVNSAVRLKKLNDSQIHIFCQSFKDKDILQKIKDYPNLHQLLTSPLILTILGRISTKEVIPSITEEISSTSLSFLESHHLGLSSKDFITTQILDEYISQSLSHIDSPKKKKLRLKWLIWLARNLENQSETEFLIETMQTSLLKSKLQRRLYRAILVLLCGLAGHVIGVLIASLFIGFKFIESQDNQNSSNSKYKFLAGSFLGYTISQLFFLIPAGGFVLGAFVGLSIKNEKIETIEAFDFTISKKRIHQISNQTQKGFRWAFTRMSTIALLPIILINLLFKKLPAGCFLRAFTIMFALPFLILISALYVLWVGLAALSMSESLLSLTGISSSLETSPLNLPINLAIGLTILLGLFVLGTSALGLFYGFIYGFQSDIQKRAYPNQGVWQSLKTSAFMTLLTVPLFIFFIYVFGLSQWTLVLIVEPILSFGITGLACIQHFALRLTLFIGGFIPWNYASFLDDCSNKLLLQRVGGRYRFMHKLLQEHFAEMSLAN